MNISLQNIGKAYKRHWLYQKLTYNFGPTGLYAILGENASGKSTLLRLIIGLETANEGSVDWQLDGKSLNINNYYKHFSLATPYQDIFEQLTLREHTEMQRKFKPLLGNMTTEEFAEKIELSHALDKSIKDFSSGMRQRFKVGLSLLSESNVVLLDEPTINLDKKGWAWYNSLLKSQSAKRLILVFSNYQEHEYESSIDQVELKNFK